MSEVKRNSLEAWMLASRPKTLSGAAMPVMVALSMVWSQTGVLMWTPALLCILFALIMQIDANFVNDYFDCIKGVDREDRLGPKRACAQGWVSLTAMKKAIVLTTLIACLTGLPLVYWGGWEMIGIGIACVVFCFLYTTLLSRLGMGDVLVLLFFGIVPVCATYYIQTHTMGWDVFYTALSCGMVTDCLLIVNNYRDRETDAKVGKRTLVTIIGAEATEWLYFALGAGSVALVTVTLNGYAALLLTPWLILHIRAWKRMKEIARGKQLNKILELTSVNILAYGVFVCAALLLFQ